MNRKLNCAIVDDEPLALDLLESYIRKTPFLELCGRYSNAVDALKGLESAPAELLFLDIQMPELSGLDLARMIDPKTRIVFTTAFERYAIEGYKVNAIDYLLKPVSYPEFLQTAEKAAKMAETGTGGEPAPESIFVKSDYKLVQIRFDEILYIEGLRDYLKIYSVKSRTPILTLMSMKNMAATLPAEKFVRVHKSYIVNKEKIESIDRGRIIIGETSIPIGDNYKGDFQKSIGVELK